MPSDRAGKPRREWTGPWRLNRGGPIVRATWQRLYRHPAGGYAYAVVFLSEPKINLLRTPVGEL